MFDVEINANVFHFDGVSYLFNSARDITERKLQQQELERRVAARTEELATARAEAESASAAKTTKSIRCLTAITSAPWNTACRPPPARASASTGW